MSKKVWLITGAGRGMGVEFVRAALAAAHSVVASGRDRDRVSRVLGTSSDLLPVTLDVTNTLTPRLRHGPPSIALVESTYWSITLRASTPATSRSWRKGR